MKTFADLGLTEKILRAVEEKGYKTPSPIQERAIPTVLKGKDMLAAAQTGTGKTAGFTLPMMQLLSEQKGKGKWGVKALILTPTRELAAQIHENIEMYGKYLNLKSLVVFGGVNIKPQISKLKAGVDILVATPGRLLDLCNQGACKLTSVQMLVLDEADRMLDMGFINDMRKVVKMLPSRRQNLLFSATFSKEIRSLTREFLHDPVTVEVAAENTAAELVKQSAYRCDAGDKADITIQLIREGDWDQVLIFTRTKHGANRLSKKLDSAGISSSAIHGNKSQGARVKALEGFKKRSIRVLVATDIAARGLDIAQLPHVINYELPNVPADYVHRIGRTGRAGREGEAISLVSNDERAFFTDICKLIKQKVKLQDVEGFPPANWPLRAPSTSEVTKQAARRKEEERKKRGPRNSSGRGGSPRGKSSGAKRDSNRDGDSRRKEGAPARKRTSKFTRRRRSPRRSD